MRTNQFGNQGWTPDRIKNLSGKTFVITGTTSGTGFEASKILLSKGARVVMLNRNLSKAKETIATLKHDLGNSIDVMNIQMDLAQQASVKKAATEVLEKVNRIDALICNAAIAQVPKQTFTVDGFESQLGVNHYGNFLLQALLYPRIEESAGRIVVVGSMGYNLGIRTIQFEDMNWDNNYGPNEVYSQSKLAQIMCVYELQDRLSVSQRYLSDTLKKETGKTSTEHLQWYLIDEAKNNLLNPHLTIAEVAYKLGFEYPPYFSRLVKKKIGISPTLYREKYELN